MGVSLGWLAGCSIVDCSGVMDGAAADWLDAVAVGSKGDAEMTSPSRLGVGVDWPIMKKPPSPTATTNRHRTVIPPPPHNIQGLMAELLGAPCGRDGRRLGGSGGRMP